MKQITNIFLTALLLISAVACYHQPITNLTIDWEQEEYQILASHWGVNDYEMVTPHLISQKELQDYSRELNPSVVRLHHALIADSFTIGNTPKWDVDRIKTCFYEARKAFPEAKFMVNPIAHFPSFLENNNEVLTEDGEARIINMFVEFVKLMKELNVPVHSIEVFNEKDNAYEAANHIPQYWRLFNKVVNAIKAENPDVKIAGPALTWPKELWVESFLDSCGHHTDYLTWHGYYSGTPETPTPDVLYSGVDHIDSLAGYVNRAIKAHGFDHMKSCLTEYNVQWTWEPFEIRHANTIGAIYQSMIVDRMAKNELDAVMVWHLKGFSYGLINNENKVRSTGQLYLWGRHYLTGTKVESFCEDPNLQILAVNGVENQHAILIANRGNFQKMVPSADQLLQSKAKIVSQLCNDGFEEQLLNEESDQLQLPPYSLTLISNY